MASIFEHEGRWHAKYKNERGTWSTRTCGGADKATSLRTAQAWENEAREIREGRADPRAKRFQAEGVRPLAEHVADFSAMMTGKGGTAKHVSDAAAHIRRVTAAMGATVAADLTADGVRKVVAGIRDNEGKALRTCNSILRSVKTFAGWMEADGRIRHNPLKHIEAFNDSTDRRLIRRDISDDELGRIIATAQAGPVRFGMSGADRAIAYQLAAGTGFRRGELASMTPASFHLDGDAPTVSVAAGYSKRRRADTQPIDPGLAAMLAGWLKGKADGQRVLRLPDETAAMLHQDMRRARAAWICEARTVAERRKRLDGDFLCEADGEGRVFDFHALRHLYISRVVSSGASVKVAQELARHSTPTLTFGRYAHTRLADLRKALPTMPTADTPQPQLAILRATGTDDATPTRTGTETGATPAQQTGRETVRGRAMGGDTVGHLKLAGATVGDVENVNIHAGKSDAMRGNAKRSDDDGRGRIRTCVGINQRIYSPPLLAAQAHALLWVGHYIGLSAGRPATPLWRRKVESHACRFDNDAGWPEARLPVRQRDSYL